MNPDGYGKSQWDYARDVAAGRLEDHQYFAAIYEAPADLTDEALAADPVKYALMANPAWGHTVDEAEYLADYQESCRTVADFASFKYQRLNIWQTSANPWKIATRWAACAREVKYADFVGQPCWLGGDLSRARDMSGIVATFRDESASKTKYYQFAWAWLVKEYAEKNRTRAPFLQWEKDGHLEFCEEGTIDMRAIEAVVCEIHAQTPIRKFVFDPAYALEFAMNLQDKIGIDLMKFGQTIINYAKPVDDFEAGVTEQTLLHDGNPVYANQIGHAYIKTDVNNNRRVVKPPDGEWQKVDLVQAGIMSLAAAIAANAELSVYATEKPFYIGGEE